MAEKKTDEKRPTPVSQKHHKRKEAEIHILLADHRRTSAKRSGDEYRNQSLHLQRYDQFDVFVTRKPSEGIALLVPHKTHFPLVRQHPPDTTFSGTSISTRCCGGACCGGEEFVDVNRYNHRCVRSQLPPGGNIGGVVVMCAKEWLCTAVFCVPYGNGE